MQRTITVIAENGDSYPVGGCYILKRSISSQGGYYEYDLRIITPSGSQEYILYTVKYSDLRTEELKMKMEVIQSKITAALKDPTVDILDLKEIVSA